MSDEKKQESALRAGFRKAADPVLGRIGYLIEHYPSKSAAATAATADVLFLYQSILNNNHWGVFGAGIGLLACQHLFRYGDPKVTPENIGSYIDPQDQNAIVNWLKNPKDYPWECMAVMRVGAMGAMLLGGANVGGMGGEVKYGEMIASSLSLIGFGVKLGIAEKEKGAAVIPEDSRGLVRVWYKAKAYVQENPNPTAGILFNSSLVALAAESVLRQEWAKLGSVAFYILPNGFTFFSSKRAKTAPANEGLR